MSRQTLIALGGGGVSAVVSAAAASATPSALLFVHLAPLPLFLVGLGGGAMAATIAGIGGLLIAGFLGGFLAAAVYAVIHALPAWLVTRQSLRQRTLADGTVAWYPIGNALAELAVLGAIVFFAATMAVWTDGGSIVGSVSSYLDTVLSIIMPGLAEADRGPLVAMMTAIFPGVSAAWWLLIAVLNGVLAQAILTRMGKSLRPSPRYSDLTAPDWLSWLVVGAAAMALFGPGELEYMGRNLVMILAVPYFLVGLAVAHSLVARLPSPGMLLAVFYIVVIFSGWAMMAIAGVGLIEQWVGLRRRFAAPGNGQEVE
jgi:hypothetical protein